MSEPSGRASKEIRALLGILVFLALVLRLAHVHLTYVDTPIRADAREYVGYAKNLVEHGVYSKETGTGAPTPDSFRSPGYPLFLAGLMEVGGRERWYDLALYVQAVLGALLVPLTFALGRYFLPGWAAVAAAVLTAVSPHLVTGTGYLLTETLFSFLLLMALLLLMRGASRGSPRGLAAAGALFGLAYLVNETALPLPFLMAGVLIIWRPPALPVRRLGILLVIFVLFPAGWMVRNRLSVPPGGRSGSQRALSTLTHGTYPGFLYESEEYRYYPYREDPEQPLYSRSFSDFFRIFGRRVRERPLRYVSWYLFEKPYHVWRWSLLQGSEEIYVFPVMDSPYQRNPIVDATRFLMMLAHPVLVVLAFLSLPVLWLLRRRGRETSGVTSTPAETGGATATPALCLVLMLYVTLLGMVFAPWPRYAVPLRPELYAAALWPLSLIVSARSSRSPPPPESRARSGTPC